MLSIHNQNVVPFVNFDKNPLRQSSLLIRLINLRYSTERPDCAKLPYLFYFNKGVGVIQVYVLCS